MSGKFHFVDLAGSERAHKTGNIGDRFKGKWCVNGISCHRGKGKFGIIVTE